MNDGSQASRFAHQSADTPALMTLETAERTSVSALSLHPDSTVVDTQSESDLGVVPGRRMTRAVERLAQGSPTKTVEVIVGLDTLERLDSELLASLDADVTTNFDRLPFAALRLPAGSLYSLAEASGVRVIDVDAEVSAASISARNTAGVPTRGSEEYWPASGDVAIAVIDSGVYPHADLNLRASIRCISSKYSGYLSSRDVSKACYKVEDSDNYGHGTHIAGAAGGNGSISSELHVGVANNAPLVSLQVLNGKGKGRMLNVIAALDWVLANHEAHNIRVVNLSLGKVITESADLDPMVLAAEAVWDAGIVVVAAAGNHGSQGNFTILSPGNSRKIITVGSLTDSSTKSFADDYVSTYSSRGPTAFDLVMKPDLVAPGNRVIGTAKPGSYLKGQMGNLNVGCGVNCDEHYVELSGTSMAAGLG